MRSMNAVGTVALKDMVCFDLINCHSLILGSYNVGARPFCDLAVGKSTDLSGRRPSLYSVVNIEHWWLMHPHLKPQRMWNIDKVFGE